MPTPFFCNDLALDLAGDAHVTNSVGSAIMKIDARGLWDMSVEAEVFVDSRLLAPPAPIPGGLALTVLGSAMQELDFARFSRFGEATASMRLDVPFGITTATNAYGRLYVIDSEIHAALPGAGLPIELPHSIVYVDTAGF